VVSFRLRLLNPRKSLFIRIEQEAGRDPELVWGPGRKEIVSSLPGTEPRFSGVFQAVAYRLWQSADFALYLPSKCYGNRNVKILVWRK